MSEKEFLEGVIAFTQLPAVQEIVIESEKYGHLLERIAKKQGLDTYGLTEENKKEFGEELETETKFIKKLYANLEILSLQAGFSKDKINFYFNKKRRKNSIGAITFVRQFFAMIRNREQALNQSQKLHQRIDDMLGFKHHIKNMINLIESN